MRIHEAGKCGSASEIERAKSAAGGAFQQLYLAASTRQRTGIRHAPTEYQYRLHLRTVHRAGVDGPTHHQ